MITKRVCAIMSLLVLGSVLAGAVNADLVGWWRLDGNALDSSGHGYDGVLYGGPEWVPGMIGGALKFDGVDDRVEMPGTSQSAGFPATSGAVTWTMWIKASPGAATQTILCQGPAGAAHVQGNRSINVEPSGAIMVRAHTVGALTSLSSAATVNDDHWHHIAMTLAFDTDGTNDTMKVYIDGDPAQGYEVTNVNVNQYANVAADFIVTLGNRAGSPFGGSIDDVHIYDTALSLAEILTVMKPVPTALNVSPADGSQDVPPDATLSWLADEAAGTHDVYFGTTFADVNTASRADPRDVLISQDQAETTYDPAGLLAYGQTYFWRIDEVNETPDNTVFKGSTWSFTVEPYAYPITPTSATASSTQAGMGPENTINGSGLTGDLHDSEPTTMWLNTGEQPNWIQYEFDQAYKLYDLRVWNSNQLIEAFLGLGARNVTIETSLDGVTWTPLENVPEFARAPGTAGYAANTTVSFGEVTAKYVRLTIDTSWGGSGVSGLSEVRFSYVPLQARAPQPADGATDIDVDTDLSWRPGREATAHEVLLGTDADAVAAGAVTVETVTVHSYTPGALDYGTTYHWKVNEVGASGTYEGDVWSFTTQPYAVVDDFESYNDDVDAQTTIWHAWTDGVTDGKSGSQVGYDVSPFAERASVHGGTQAMPLKYSNSTFAFSEATRTFDTPQDWTARGIRSLSLYFRGAADNSGELYLKINNTKVPYDGFANEVRRGQWIPWTIDLAATGANLTNVRSLTVGVEGAGALGIVYVDDIRLYPRAAEAIEPVLPNNNDPSLAAHYEFEGDTKDRQGHYSATATGSPTYTAGKVGQALNLDNSDDQVVCTLTQEEVWPACSVSLWVKTELFSQDQYSSVFNNNSSSADFQIEMDGTNPGNYRYQGSAVSVIGPVRSDWVHLAISCDGASTRLYYDGLYVGTINVADTRFGQIAFGINRGMNNRFGGVIDDVRLYQRAISDGEVLGLAGVTKAVPKGF